MQPLIKKTFPKVIYVHETVLKMTYNVTYLSHISDKIKEKDLSKSGKFCSNFENFGGRKKNV